MSGGGGVRVHTHTHTLGAATEEDLHGVLCLNDDDSIIPHQSPPSSSPFDIAPSLQWDRTDTLTLLSTPSVSLSIVFNSLRLYYSLSLFSPILSLAIVLPLWTIRRDVVKVFGEFLLTEPTLPGCCLSSTWNSSTQIRLGFLTRREGPRQGEKAAERPLPF